MSNMPEKQAHYPAKACVSSELALDIYSPQFISSHVPVMLMYLSGSTYPCYYCQYVVYV